MLLDNLFAMIGGSGTSLILLGILAFFGFPAMGAVLCPASTALRRLQRGP